MSEKVTEVLEASFKSGEKNGKKWNLATVLTDQGHKARVFGYPKVDDEVDITYNEEYKSWSGSVKRIDKFELIESSLARVEIRLDEIVKLIKGA